MRRRHLADGAVPVAGGPQHLSERQCIMFWRLVLLVALSRRRVLFFLAAALRGLPLLLLLLLLAFALTLAISLSVSFMFPER